jgi:hypothetical protein
VGEPESRITVAAPSNPFEFPFNRIPQQVTPIQMAGQDQRTQMRTNRRPRRRGGPMGGGGGRAPVTE